MDVRGALARLELSLARQEERLVAIQAAVAPATAGPRTPRDFAKLQFSPVTSPCSAESRSASCRVSPRTLALPAPQSPLMSPRDSFEDATLEPREADESPGPFFSDASDVPRLMFSTDTEEGRASCRVLGPTKAADGLQSSSTGNMSAYSHATGRSSMTSMFAKSANHFSKSHGTSSGKKTFLRALSSASVDDKRSGCCAPLEAAPAIYLRTLLGIANFAFVSWRVDSAQPSEPLVSVTELALSLVLLLDAGGLCYVQGGAKLRARQLELRRREAFHDFDDVGAGRSGCGSLALDARVALSMLEVILCFTGVLSGLQGLVLGSYTCPNLSFLRVFANMKMLQRGSMTQWFWHSTQLRLVLKLSRKLPFTLLTLAAVAALSFHVTALLAVQVIAAHFGESEIDDALWVPSSVEAVVQGLFSEASWSEFFRPLLSAGATGVVVFLVIVAMFLFVLPGVGVSLFVQMTMQAMDNARGLCIRLGLERADTYTERFVKAFQHPRISEADFKLLAPNLGCVADFCDEFGFTLGDLEDLMFCLSQGGTRSVKLQTLVTKCLKWLDTPTKMDLLELFVTQQSIADNQKHMFRDMERNTVLSVTTVQSSCEKRRLRFQTVDKDSMIGSVLNRLASQHRTDVSCEEARQFRATVETLLKIVLEMKGGGGFAVCTGRALVNLQTESQVDFQVVDRSDAYPRGYMTELLGSHHVACDRFSTHMAEFLDPALSENDRWPAGHEAEGLPKDGFTILGIDGYRKTAAAKIVGLPFAPFKWDGVGARHTTALSLAWALRFSTSLVVVRSESGKVHALVPCETQVAVLRCEPLAPLP